MEQQQGLLQPHRSIRPGPPTQRGRTKLACGMVLVSVILERIAFYGIVGNLVMFLIQAPFNWVFYNATNALFLFTGVSYMTSFLGGWLADSFLSRFRTIVLAFIIYISSYVMFPLLYPHLGMGNDMEQPPHWCWSPNNVTNMTDIHPLTESRSMSTAPRQPTTTPWTRVGGVPAGSEVCSWAVYLALSLMAVANGSLKANISPFGADQIKQEGPVAMRVFFNWFYWCINLGALVSLGGLAYVQQEISFFWGFVVPNIGLVIAAVIFILGATVYVMRPPGGSILTNILKIFVESCRSCRRRKNNNASTVPEMDGVDQFSEPTPGCLDYAKVRHGGSFHDNVVEDVKCLGKIICVFFAMVPYWIVYFQMETTFVVQGLHMRLDFGSNGSHAAAASRNFRVPPAWLSLFDVAFLVILIPIMDRIVYPWLDKHGYHLTLRARIVIGMCFAVLAVTCAGVVEWRRLAVYWQNGTEHTHWQVIGKTSYRAADMSIFYQIPQYTLIGISEVFASVAGLELAYLQAPRSMQGLIMGLFWFTQGLGSIMGTATIYWFRGVWFFNWDSGDINCNQPCPTLHDPMRHCRCHLDYYYFFLAGLQLASILVFCLVAWKLDMGGAWVNHRRRQKQGPATGYTSSSESVNHSYGSLSTAHNNGIMAPRQVRRGDSLDTTDTESEYR